MREVKSYRTVAGAKAALDNGGRFYNLIAMANDNRITKSELAKAVGVFSSEQRAFLFLHMGLADLSDTQRNEVLSLLEPALAKRYKSAGPRRLEPRDLAEAKPGELVVVEGYPKYSTRKTRRGVAPIMIGLVMLPVPVEEQYDAYHIFATPDSKGSPGWLVVKRPKVMLAENRTRFGGVIRNYKYEDSSGKHSVVFLEPLYLTNLSAG